MIERMIGNIKKYLPLKIATLTWDSTSFHMYGSNWSFFTLSSWRISTQEKVIFGADDENSEELVKRLINMEIKDIHYQTGFLIIDPVFVLSNNEQIEIFSTDTYEPWTLRVGETSPYISTPSVPHLFDP